MSWGASWGETAAERARTLPCDALLPQAPVRLHRAIDVAAPRALVYRWLCQLSVAPYSYDLIDNLGRRSPRELTPGAGTLHDGQPFLLILRLRSHEPDRQLTLGNRRTAVTYEVSDADRAAGTRILARMLFAPPGGALGTRLLGPPLALGDLVMMRRQLLNLRTLAERDAARAARAETGRTGVTLTGGLRSGRG